MMLLSFCVIAALSAHESAAVPAPMGGVSGCQSTTQSFNANFDDIPVLPVESGGIAAKVPQPYGGLLYQAFAPFTPGVNVPGLSAPLPGLVPHSPPNAAAINVQIEATAGTPMLTTNFPDSNTTSFTLSSFHFGCGIRSGTTAAALPTACQVSVTGYEGNDNQVSNAFQVCSQQFQYSPSTMLGAQQLAFTSPVDPCFKDIQFAIVQFSLPGGTAVANSVSGLILDDLNYSYTSCQ